MVLADGRLAPDESDKILITPLSLITLHVEKYFKHAVLSEMTGTKLVKNK